MAILTKVSDQFCDVSFTMAMLAKVSEDLCVDEKMTYASVFSNEAMMTYQVAISIPHIFAAIAPIEGSVIINTNPFQS